MRKMIPLFAAIIVLGAVCGASKGPQTDQAYVTLLYGDEFLLGVRVLGKSIRDTGTTKDLAVLVSDGVSKDAIKLLEADGWLVETIDLLANPNRQRPTRFWGVYTKLKIFNMTHYNKVVYLDADTIVLKSIEDLFECQKFCANLKHSERLNSGVMVVEPSKELFEDMLAKVNSLYSYTGGDQGFLNSYYDDFPNARLFDPSLSAEERKARSPTMERLSTLYNADVGLYVLANKWMVDGSQLRVVHYTLGPLKPWDWWTEWLLKPVDLWQNIRKTLKPSLPGTGGGQDPHNILVVRLLVILPILLLALYHRRLLLQIHHDIRSVSFAAYTRQLFYRSTLPIYSLATAANGQQYSSGGGVQMVNGKCLPPYVGSLSIVVCYCVALFSLGASFALIPHQVMPWTGMILLYEWTFFLFILIFGKYLDAVYSWGRSSCGIPFDDTTLHKGHSRQSMDRGSVVHGLGVAFVAILIPCLPFLFGITAMFMRVGMLVAGGMVLVSLMTYAAEHVSIQMFVRGRDEAFSAGSLLLGSAESAD